MNPIPNFAGYYVTDDGRVYSYRTNAGKIGATSRLLRHNVDKDGYHFVRLAQNGKYKKMNVGRLVLLAFARSPITTEQVSHIDGDPSNNRLSNLLWESPSANNQRKKQHGTAQHGSRNGNARLTEDDVYLIRYMFPKAYFNNTEIARLFKVDNSLISLIRLGKVWKHVTEVRNENIGS